MYNFLKSLFGLAPDDNQRPSSGVNGIGCEDPRFINVERKGRQKTDEMDNPDDVSGNFEPNMNNRFGFPIFSDPFEIHNYIDGLINDLQRNMNFFGFIHQPSLTWEEGNNEQFFHSQEGEPLSDSSSLRNSYLKSSASCAEAKKDVDLDGRVNVEDVENLLNSRAVASHTMLANSHSSPTVYSQSVYIRTVRHPDGSVETVKKVRDHTGKEETIITQENSVQPSDFPVTPADDVQGISIFRKFFPF